MNAHDTLERQLLASVGQRAAAAAPRRRWRHRTLILAISALAVSAGIATAAVQLLHGPSASHAAKKLAHDVLMHESMTPNGTLTTPACAPGGSRRAVIVDSPVSPEVAALLPPGPPTPAGMQLARRVGHGVVIAPSVRILRFAPSVRMLAYATRGAFQARDPAGCLRARMRELRSLHPTQDEVARRAAALLAAREDTAPAQQSLSVTLLPPPGVKSYGGTTLHPGIDLARRGLLMSGGFGPGRTAFVGRAPKKATALRIRPARLVALPGVRGGVSSGFYAVVLPQHSGSASVVFLDRARHVISHQQLRR